MSAPRSRRAPRALPRLVAAASVAVAALTALTACSQPVPFDPAPDAADPDCAAVVVRLPDEVAGQAERETNAQGTGAWGSPASVLLRCGVEPPGPTTLRCVSVDDVDWIIDESDAPRYRFTTYGRTPAVEVVVDNDVVAGTTVITDLSPAVAAIPAEGGCTDLEELPAEQ
ncbi:hypothetical protein BCL57_002033 [Agromyces flavus]|uniref:DUF3515 domain-containing protein n=1 Tax=Agromyces flavus TaxID=589382 RepID=A0A1H1PRI1_9MICO|nr:DUF3515 family protein [Agromyces flavus]MCP2367874.1 hypothetical protein [Agromyces flavus]GGI47335.1 hypothetical protein GCM10010932_20230 [Agromyces flavus]SDS13760.1 Protein of unknown function [Agromyces flavus]